MTPAEQFHATVRPNDTGNLADPQRLAPILGSVGGLLMAVNSSDKLLRAAGAVLMAVSLYYGVASRPRSVST